MYTVLLFALCIIEFKSDALKDQPNSDRTKQQQIEKGKKQPDEFEPWQAEREESPPIKEQINDENWENYVNDPSDHQSDNYSTYVLNVICIIMNLSLP